MSLVGIFALSGDMIKLKCPCGKSELQVTYTKDRKIRLTVPCLICPTPHNYLLGDNIFFEKDLFTLPCAFSGVNMCYIGSQKQVLEAMKATERELIEMLGESNLDDFDELRASNTRVLTDPQILDIIIYVIRDLESEGCIKCRCLDRTETVYEIAVADTYVQVSCPKCGASKRIPTDSLISATNFLHCDSLELE